MLKSGLTFYQTLLDFRNGKGKIDIESCDIQESPAKITTMDVSSIKQAIGLFDAEKIDEVISLLCDDDPNARNVKLQFREKLNFSPGPDRENVLILEAALRCSPGYVGKKNTALAAIIGSLRKS